MSERRDVLEHFRGQDFATKMSVCSSLASVSSLIETEARIHGLHEFLSGDLEARDACVAEITRAMQTSSDAGYLNEHDAYIAVIVHALAHVDRARFEAVAETARESGNLWWASWMTEHVVQRT